MYGMYAALTYMTEPYINDEWHIKYTECSCVGICTSYDECVPRFTFAHIRTHIISYAIYEHNKYSSLHFQIVSNKKYSCCNISVNAYMRNFICAAHFHQRILTTIHIKLRIYTYYIYLVAEFNMCVVLPHIVQPWNL